MFPVPRTELFIVLLAAFVAIAGAGVYAMRQGHGGTVAGYFLAGRLMGWPILGGSLFVTIVGSLAALWVVMPSAWRPELWILVSGIVTGMLVIGLVFMPRVRDAAPVTFPGYVAARFGRRVGVAMSLSSILLTVLVRIPVVIVLGGAALRSLLGWDLTMTAILAIVVPGLFAVAGGYSAVLATQGVEAVFAIGGIAVLAVRGSWMSEFAGDGWGGVPGQSVPLLAGAAAVMGFWYICVDQFTVQRSLAARSTREVRGGAISAAVLTVAAIVLLAAASGTTLMPAPAGAPEPDFASGLLGAGILSIIMAYVSGHFLSMSALFTSDVFALIRPGKDETSLVLVGRLCSSVAAILAMLTALSTSVLPSPPARWFSVPYIVLAPPVVAITVIGMPWRRMHARGARWGLALGWVGGALFAALRMGDGALPEAYLEGVLVSFLVAALVLVAVSLAAAPLTAGASAPAMLEQGWGGRKG
ncbi:MAG: hypothetical protein AB1428_02665 [Bacteroidota bacterium]